MCTLTAAVFTRNDSRGSLSRRLGTPHVRFAQRLQTGPVHLRQSGSVLDLVLAHVDVSTLQEVTRQSGASISAAFDGCGWIPGGGGLNRNPTPGVGRHVLNSSTTAACRICRLFWAFQNHRSLRYRTQGMIMLSRARYSWPGSNYPVMLDDCSAGPPPSVASAAEASLPDPSSTRASSLSGVSPLPGSRPRLSMYAAPDMGPFSGAYAAGFFSLAEKSSLEKNLGPFCCHKNTSFCMT